MRNRISVAMSATILLVLVQILQVLVRAEVYLWPEPQVVKWQDGPTIVLSPNFTFDAPANLDLSSAAERYKTLIQTELWLPVQTAPSSSLQPKRLTNSSSTLEKLVVSVTDLTADLQHGVDESYTLVINTSVNAVLLARTVWGAMRGLETFSQLIQPSDSSPNGTLIIEQEVTISDFPNFPHRGVLLDVSRNFYPIEDIKRTIRALSYNKLNVLHLHISDAMSFPLEIKSDPELASKSSIGPEFVYSQADVAVLVAYARSYGVRLIPEIDVPGHTASWGGAHPQIVTCLNEFWLPGGDWSARLAAEPGTGQLNPLLEETYEVVKNVIDEVTSIFPDSFYHSGGDEVAPACWEEDILIEEYLNSSIDHSLSDLLRTFITRTRNFVYERNKTLVLWEDVLTGVEVKVNSSLLPPAHTILQTWNNGPINTKVLTAAGYRTIVSSSEHYYLDCGHGGWLGNDSRYDENFKPQEGPSFNYGGDGGSYCAPFKTWARVYSYDITANLTEEEAKLVIGGEVALWSEQADATVLDSKLWPRSSAMAESLWSGNRDPKNTEQKRLTDALDRLNDWRYRLVHRGISAEPLQPMWCLKNPGVCNLA